MYPRYSETFIVTEILAHEAAGLRLEIFSLRAPVDTHFQDAIARVRSSVQYIPSHTPRAHQLWALFEEAAAELPNFWKIVGEFSSEEVCDVFQAVLLAIAVRQKGLTHLHAHFATVATSIARMAAKLAGISYSFTAHAKDIFHSDVSDADLRRKLLDAHAAVTVSEYNLRYLRDRHGRAASRVKRIYNGVDLTRFPYSPGAERDNDIVAVGRLVEKKGFHDLVTACALLRDRRRPVSCRIVGSGPLEADLRSYMRELSLDKKVVAIGPRPQFSVVKEMAGARIFVAPSVEAQDGNRDGLPTVLLEAMALGTPCVGTPIAGIPEALIHEQTGLLVPAGDPQSLAGAMERLLADATLRGRLARNARDHVESEFDIDRNTVALRHIFSSAAISGSEAA
jgi:glycosyltransferase involved in cell wall biosynthesis